MVRIPNRILIYDDIKFDFRSYSGEDWTFFMRFGVPYRPSELAYAMPDLAGSRQIISPAKAQLEHARAELNNKLIPLWTARESQPKLAPAVFPVELSPVDLVESKAREGVTPEDKREDNRWSRQRFGLNNPFLAEWVYVAHPSAESSPPLLFQPPVPTGKYNVKCHLRTLDSRDGQQAVSIRVQVLGTETASEPRVLTLEPLDSGQERSEWFELGEFEVSDGSFSIRFEMSRGTSISAFGNLLFESASADTTELSQRDFREQRERLRTLGYLD